MTTDNDARRALDAALASGEIDGETYRRQLPQTFADPQAPRRRRLSYADAAPLLAGGELSGARLTWVRWKKKSLRGARLAGADFAHANLSRADLQDADLAGANLKSANLQGANLRGANLTGAVLAGANLMDADLADAALTRADAKSLSGAGSNWNNARAPGVRLRYAALMDAKFEGANLAGADLTDGDLDDSLFRRADLTGATLVGASFENARLEDTALRGADASHALFNLAGVFRCDFADADLTDADASGSRWEDVSLKGAKLRGTSFAGSRHERVDMSDAQLRGATLKSVAGYTGDELKSLRDRGGAVSRFYVRRAATFVREHVALQGAVFALLLAAVGFWLWRAADPAHWDASKFLRAAQERWLRLDYAGAEKLYRQQITQFADHRVDAAAARTALAKLLLETKRFDEADKYLRGVIAEFPPATPPVFDAKLALADSLVDQARYDDAEAALRPLTDDFRGDPRISDVWKRLVKLAQMRGEPARLQRVLEDIVKRQAELEEGLVFGSQLALAELARFRGDLDGAIARYREIAVQPGGERFSARALCSLIQIDGERLNYAGAETTLAELQQRFPHDRDIVLEAEIYLASVLLGDPPRAAEGVAQLRQIVQDRNPPNRQFWAARTMVEYYRNNHQPEAADAMLAYMQRQFGAERDVLPDLNAMLAETDIAHGRPLPALQKVQAVAKLPTTPQQRRALTLARAHAFAALGDLDHARAAYQDLAAIDDADAQIEAWTGEAEVDEAAGRRPEAIALLETAVQRDIRLERQFGTWARLAQLRGKNGDVEGEGEELRSMVDRFAEWPLFQANALMALADCYLRQQKPDEALAAYRRVAALDESNKPLEALRAMQQIYLARDDGENAARVLQEITVRFPDRAREQLAARLENAELRARQGDAGAVAEFAAVAAAGQPGPRLGALQALLRWHTDHGEAADAAQTYATIVAEGAANLEAVNAATFVYARLACQNTDRQTVVTLLERLVQANAGKPAARQALENLAQCWIIRGEFGKAHALLERALADASSPIEPADKARLEKVSSDTAFGEADELRQNGAPTRAVAMYQELIRRARDPQTRAAGELELARTDMGLKDFDGARQALQDIPQIKGVPPALETDARLLLAETEIEQGRLDEAERLYGNMTQAGRDDWRLRAGGEMGLGEVALRRSRFVVAHQHYERARKLSKDAASEVKALTAIARLYASQRQFDEAAKTYDEIVARHGDDPTMRMEAELNLARLLATRGRLDEALAAYLKFAEQYGAARPAYEALNAAAHLYGERGDLPQALATLQEIDRRFPEAVGRAAETRLDYAAILRTNGKREEARQALEAVVAQYPNSAPAAAALERLAQNDLEDGEFEHARLAYQRLQKAFVNDPKEAFRARLGLGEVAARQGQRPAAIKIFTELARAATDPPQKIQAGVALAQALRESGKWDEADAEYERLLREFPDSVELRGVALMGRAAVRRALGKAEEAVEFYKMTAEEAAGRPEESAALQAWANIEVDRGHIDEAEPLFARLLKITPANAAAVAEMRLRAAERRVNDELYATAQELLDKAEPDLPKDRLAAVRRLQARIAAGEKNFGKARQIFENMKRDFAADDAAVGAAALGLADLAFREGNPAEALQQYEAIADHYGKARTAGLALLAKAEIFERLARPDEQEAALRRVLTQVTPDRDLTVRARLGLADLARERRNFPAALTDYLAIIEDFPENDLAIWAKNGAAHVYYETKQDKDAETMLKQLIAQYPSDHEAVVDAKKFLDQLYTRK